MGGNVRVNVNNKEYKAEKIPVKEIGLDIFRKDFQNLFHYINYLSIGRYCSPIWTSDIIDDGYVFNGSSSFIMNPNTTDNILKYKPTIGDIDITVDEDYKEEIFQLLESSKLKKLTDKITYIGSNKSKIKSIGNQINAIFQYKHKDKIINCQVDFEFLEYQDKKPTDWAKFSHNSSIADAIYGIKAVHHKFLLRAIVGAASINNDILVCPPSSTPDNYKISKSALHNPPRMYKFSVGKGLRIAYEMLGDEPIEIDGKVLYRDIPTKQSQYIENLDNIFEFIYKKTPSKQDRDYFESFGGNLQLMQNYLNQEEISDTHDRYLKLLWSCSRDGGQELEANNPDLDLEVKMKGYRSFINMLNLEDKSEEWTIPYYKQYGKRFK